MSYSRHVLILDGVSKAYTEGAGEGVVRRVIVRDLCACFEPGERVAIVGRSGSGKTTVLNLVSGIDLPDAGRIVFNGVALDELDDRARTLTRRARMGFVFQFFNLVPTLTVLENVQLPLDLNGMAAHESHERAVRMLERVGLAARVHSFPDRLSGGEQQRVALARALVHEPALVLADEPTGNLDSETGREVLALLDELTRESGGLVLMVTHSDEAARRADRVLRLSQGRFAEDTPGS
ncbi:MAG: ABC transporter ATP-binding protein [Gammaproteobacteria bacterium]